MRKGILNVKTLCSVLRTTLTSKTVPMHQHNMFKAQGASKADEVRGAFNSALARTPYSCSIVSWQPLALSSMGVHPDSVFARKNCDSCIQARSGENLYTIRADDWNERHGIVDSRDIRLIVGNCDERSNGGVPLRNLSLCEFLEKPSQNGARYTGISDAISLANSLDRKVYIRFQTTFLPVNDMTKSVQFAAEMCSYQPLSGFEPRNLVLFATNQGTSVLTDTYGPTCLKLHYGAPNSVGEYWLKAKHTRDSAGVSQSRQGLRDASAGGKKTADYIGVPAISESFNALMIIQIPLQQRGQSQTSFGTGLNNSIFSSKVNISPAPVPFGSLFRTSLHRGDFSVTRPANVSNPAGASRGDNCGQFTGLRVRDPIRSSNEHITVTVELYRTVVGGVPSTADVLTAVKELDALYAACSSGNLNSPKFNFMTPPNAAVPPLFTYPQPAVSLSGVAAKKSVDNAAREFVLKRVALFNNPSREKLLELRLLVFGAVDDPEVRALLAEKFNVIDALPVSSPFAPNNERMSAFEEIGLLIKGALRSID